MNIIPTRKIYRRFFRRLRIYLPLVAVVLLLLVGFLPLSGDWMARRAEKEIKNRVGLDVTISRLEVQLATARVQVSGITVGKGQDAFVLAHADINGSLSALLAGGGRWPDTVNLYSPSRIDLVRTQDGSWELSGPARQLLDTIKKLPTTTNAGGAGAPKSPGTIGHTPSVALRDVRLFVESPNPDWPDVNLTLDRVQVLERATPANPWRVVIRGAATARTSERFSVTATLFEDQNRIELEGDLTGLALPFSLPPVGDFEGKAKDIDLKLVASLNDSLVEGGLNLQADSFTIARAAIGGERWQDRNLAISLSVKFDLKTQRLTVGEVLFQGDQIDAAAGGHITLAGDLPGEARLSVFRLPPAALTLGRRELDERLGVRVEPDGTSPTLRLEASVAGPFANPAELVPGQLSLLLRDWSIQTPDLPVPIAVRIVDVIATSESLTLRDIRIEAEDFNLQVSGEIPLTPEVGQGAVVVAAEGNTETGLRLLEQFGLRPEELDDVSVPIRLTARLPLSASRIGTDVRVDLIPDQITSTMTWKKGQLMLRRFPDPIQLEAGSLVYGADKLTLNRLRFGIRSLSIALDGALYQPLLAAEGLPFDFRGSAIASGRLEDVVAVLGRTIALPHLPRKLTGAFQLDVGASGNSALLSSIDARGRLILEQVGMILDTKHRPVEIADLGVDIEATTATVSLRRGSLVVKDAITGDSTLSFDASATDRELRANAKVRSHLEFLTSVLARDLSDLVMEGVAPAEGWITAIPREPLPPGPNIAQRWIAFFKREGLVINHHPDADLRLDYEGVYRQEAPITVFAREFPVPITNVRGSATFRPGQGIVFSDAEVDLGSSRDARVDVTVLIGKPTRIEFIVSANHLDINEWLDGWGERPWASKPIAYIPRWKSSPNPVQFVQINGKIKAKTIEFLQFKGDGTDADLEVQAWSRTPARLWLRNVRVNAYGGNAEVDEMSFAFPPGQRPILKTDARFMGIELKGFMDALFERPQSMDGLLTGNLNFEGQLINYPTYQGRGEYFVEQSSVVGNVFLTYWKELVQANSTTGGRDSTIEGKVSMVDQTVTFDNLNLISPAVNLTADGSVNFRGKLDFDITASVISKRLQNIPVISVVGDLWDMLGRQIISYRLEGTLKSPRYYAIPTVIGRLQEMRDLMTRQLQEVPLTSSREPRDINTPRPASGARPRR